MLQQECRAGAEGGRALRDKLAGKGTVETGDYSLNPEYNEPGPRERPIITGYTAQNTITVETTELMLLGSLIDGAILPAPTASTI